MGPVLFHGLNFLEAVTLFFLVGILCLVNSCVTDENYTGREVPLRKQLNARIRKAAQKENRNQLLH